jgi:hypothetical protein
MKKLQGQGRAQALDNLGGRERVEPIRLGV